MGFKAVAELIVRAARCAVGPTTALAVREGRIEAVAGPERESELLATWRDPETIVLNEPGLVVLPAFVDTHNHLTLAARNTLGVPVSQARDIDQVVELIRERAARPLGRHPQDGYPGHPVLS